VTLEDLGYELHFVKEGGVMTPDSRSSDKFMHGIRVMVAKNYVDVLSEEARKGMLEKARQGIWPARAPYGYRNVLRGDGKKVVEVDPVLGPKVKALFEEYATGQFSLKVVAKRARNNGLDWVAFSEHMNTATSATPVAFAELRADVLAQDRPGTFVTIPAAEVALADADGATLGHRTMLFFGDIAQLHTMQLADLRYNGQDTDIGNCENVAAWAASLSDRFGPMLLVPHHTGAARPAPVDWGCHHPEFEPVAEVYSEHGSSMYSDYAWDPPNSGGVAIGSIESALDPDMYGLRLGFIAGTDSHDSDPGDVCRRDLMVGHATAGGLTVAMIPETETFTRAALLEAFQQRSTYATTGPLIPVQLQFVSLGMDLGYMGQDIALPEGQPLAIELNYPPEFQPWVASVALRAPGARWEMQRSGAGRWSYHFAPAQVPELLYAEIQVTGRMWNAGECDDGGTDDAEWIWLSPSWVNLVDG
ncbi:MAG TPA: hypothetical protein PKY30_19040, partial [Myxococcota bacterium]|nr:hypothetical protein [Myxococcota bacterium]